MSKNKFLPNYLPVWEQQYDKILNLLKDEIKKPKKERKKENLKRFVSECKELKKLIRKIKGDNDEGKTIHICPNCHHNF